MIYFFFFLFTICSASSFPLDDHKASPRRVPNSFPGSVALVTVEADDLMMEDTINLNSNYRRYGDAGNAEFIYFVTRILPAINPAYSNFKRQKGTKLISEMFTVTDEAFGLIILYNEHHVWEQQQKIKEHLIDGSVTKEKKRFVDANSGKREGWEGKGKHLFNKLCKEIVRLRSDPITGSGFEMLMRERFLSESNGGNNYNSSTAEQEEELEENDYVDDGLNVLLQKKN